MRARCLCLAALLLAACPVAAAPVTVEQVIYREHPAFRPAEARLSVGRDGNVYLASGGNDTGYVLRLRRDGSERFGRTVVYALGNATANADGVVATANAHFAHAVTLYNCNLEQTASLADFLNNDTVGWSAPPHVEAGASGDFYGLDHARDRIVRLDARGKQLRAYAIPRRPAGPAGRAWDFRVCEKTESFYIVGGGPLYRVGFDGKVRWVLDARLDPGVRWGYYGNAGGFDVDDDGNLYLLGPHGSEVRILSPDGKQTGKIVLQGGPRPPVPGASDGSVRDLRVHGDDLVIRRRHPTELFHVHDRKTGRHRLVVRAQAEQLRVHLAERRWLAGSKAALKIDLGPETVRAPAWRIWLRSLDEADERELKWVDGAVEVPADLGGVYLLRISAEVRPWQGGTRPDYLVRTWVEVRQPKTSGTLSIWTRRRGSADVPVALLLRAKGQTRAEKVTLQLVEVASGKVAASEEHTIEPNVVFTGAVLRCAAELRPGRYRLTAVAPGRTVAGQTIEVGRAGAWFANSFFVQYGDYGPTYPQADAWDLPAVSAAHVRRADRLGLNLFVDRLGFPTQAGATLPARLPPGGADLEKLVGADPDGVAAEMVKPPVLLGPTLAGYRTRGISQMAILMGNDAGLPLGTGFDNRKPEQLTKEIVRVTQALRPHGGLRGWSWASNWWVFHERGAAAARTPQEKKEYEQARAEALKTGKWAAVLDRVAERRWSYARDAQGLFNATLKKALGYRPLTASAAPYRNVESYPPLSLSNVDEIDLQAQWEQIAVPYVSAHNVDFYKRPGKRAWLHPEVWNDAGTGEQVVPTLFMGLMRGADGVGCSGPIPPWAPRPRDDRHGHAGTASLFRAMGTVMKTYGPLLERLHNNDRVAIVVSGRMLKIDDWPNVYGTHFARLLEAYCACLHAHHPATHVFADDLAPGVLEKFRAVLVIDQRVEFEPALLKALRAAKKAGVRVFHDGTSRADLVREFTPLGISFTHFEKDPSPASDDAAYERFPRYVLAGVPALRKALDPVASRPAKVDNPEVLLSERKAEQGRYLFVVNNTTPPHGPGRMWRVSLLCAARVPLVADIDLGPGARHVYDVFAGKKIEPVRGVVQADCRDLHGRLFAILPEAIDRVELTVATVPAEGGTVLWRARVLDRKGRPIQAVVPLRVRLFLDGQRIDEQITVCHNAGGDARLYPTQPFRCPRLTAGSSLRLEAQELFSGKAAAVAARVSRRRAASGFREVAPAKLTGEREKELQGKPVETKWLPAAERFGPHVRDLAVSGDGRTAYLSTFNWDHNLYALDLATGKTTWRQRLGHYFTFAPKAVPGGVAVQGFDFHTSEGYHLYLVDQKGRPARRFALYGTPGRLPHRFVPSILNDRVNQLVPAPDGSWVATAGNLGLAVWRRDGRLAWRLDWWQTGQEGGLLHAVDADTLLLVRGLEVIACTSGDGHVAWRRTLAPSGETTCVRSSADGRTIALLTTADGGRVFVLRDGKVKHTIATGGNDMALSADGQSLAIVEGRQLKFYAGRALRWVLPGDDVLHHPRIAADGKRIACASEIGTLYVAAAGGKVLLERDMGAVVVPAFLPGGDLLAAGWMGRIVRLSADFAQRWSVLLRPQAKDVRGRLLPRDEAPTSRYSGWGNALARPLPLTPNLLGPRTCRIELRSSRPHTALVGSPEALVDGKAEPPPQPWLAWPEVGWFAEGKTFNALQFDTFRTRLRVEAITLVEDARHPESWLRDVRLEYWDAAAERWRSAGRLLSDAAVHSHRLARPAESSRWRLVPSGLSGNLRLAEVVLHGKAVGPSHPDVVARRPVAVLFDEGDDLKEAGLVHDGFGLKFAFGGAYSGGRFLRLEADRSVAAPWKPPFGHVLPDWDFEIAEKPVPGQYRYLQFACKALSEKTTGLVLRLDGDGYGRSVSCHAGKYTKEADALARQVAARPPSEWTVVRIDLWEVFKKPVRVRGLRLAATGGPAGFDRVLLGRSLEELARAKR